MRQKTIQRAAQAQKLRVFLGHELVARAGNLHLDHGRQAWLAWRGVGTQRNHAVAQVNGFFKVMGDKQHRQAAVAHQARDLVLQALARHGVQRAKGLVHHDQLRLLRQAARNLHPLLHAARELRREFARVFGQAHGGQHFGNAHGPLCGLDAGRFQRQADVVGHGAPRQQGAAIVLEHKRHVARRAGNRLPMALDRAAAGCHKTRRRAQQRGLAAARGANHADELAARHCKAGG